MPRDVTGGLPNLLRSAREDPRATQRLWRARHPHGELRAATPGAHGEERPGAGGHHLRGGAPLPAP